MASKCPRIGTTGSADIHPSPSGQPQRHAQSGAAGGDSPIWLSPTPIDVGVLLAGHEGRSTSRTSKVCEGYGEVANRPGAGDAATRRGQELVRVAALAGRAPERPPPDTRVDRIFDSWCAEEPDSDAQAVLRRAMAGIGEGRLLPQPSHAAPPVRATGPPPGLGAVVPPPSLDADAFMTEVDALTGHVHGLEARGWNPAPDAASIGGTPSPENGPYAGFVTRDPYLPSPGQTALRPRMMSVSPCARPGPYERPEEDETFRGGPAAANALAATLAATRATTPFSSGVPTNMGSLRSIDPTKHPVPTLIHDDDELAAPPDPGGPDTTAGA